MKNLTFAQVRLILAISFLILYTLLEIYVLWNINMTFESIFVEVLFYILLFSESLAFKVQVVSSCDYLAHKITKSWY